MHRAKVQRIHGIVENYQILDDTPIPSDILIDFLSNTIVVMNVQQVVVVYVNVRHKQTAYYPGNSIPHQSDTQPYLRSLAVRSKRRTPV